MSILSKMMRIAGRDPLGNAKAVNVDTDGNLQTSIAGRLEKSIYTPKSYAMAIDHTDADVIFLTYDSKTDVLWGRSATVNNRLIKSIDQGDTWQTVNDMSGVNTIQNLLILQTGTILALVQITSPAKTVVQRSTDGITWTQVLDFGSIITCLDQGWCEHPTNGVFLGEYPNDDYGGTNLKLWVGTNDGLNFTATHTWPRSWPGSSAGAIRHIHMCKYDKWAGKVWVSTGDNDDQCRVYTTTDGITLTEIGSGSQQWRTVSMLFDRSYVYMPTDATLVPSPVFRLLRTNGYTGRTELTDFSGHMNSTSWYSIALNNDEFITFSSQDLTMADNYIHAYLVRFDSVTDIGRLRLNSIAHGNWRNPAQSANSKYIYAYILNAEPFVAGSGFVRFTLNPILPDIIGEV